MRLCGLHIYGYGIFRDFTLAGDDFNHSPVLIYGLNEAGKSTFMSFVRGVLFGFKAEGGKPVPVHGGRTGGWLLLENGAGELFRIERTGKGNGKVVVELPDGTTEGEGFLRTRVLGGISPVLFKNVFAMGIDELRKLDDLKKEEVSAHIYGAGTGVSPGRLAGAVDYLQSAARNLFNPRGRVQEINKLLSRLKEIDKRVKQLEQQPAQYWQLKDEEVELERLRASLDSRRKELERRKNRLENLLKARGPWVIMESLRAQMEKLAPVDDFPADGISRLEKLLERRNQKREALRRCDVSVRDLRDRLASNVYDRNLLGCGQEIRELYDQRALFLEKRQKLWEEETRVKQLEEQVQERLANLGPRWDESSVLELDLSVSTYRGAEEFVQCFRALEEELKGIARAAESRAGELKQRQQKLKEIEKRLSQLPIYSNPVSLEGRFTILEKLAVSLHERQTVEAQIEGERHRQQDLRARKDFATKNLEGARGYAGLGWVVWVLAAAGVTGLLAAGLNFTGILFLTGGLGLAFLMKMVLRKIQKEESNRREHLAGEIQTLQQTLETVENNIEQFNERLHKLQQKIDAASRDLNCGPGIGLIDIPGIRLRLEQERDAHIFRKQLERERAEAEKLLADAYGNWEQLQEEKSSKHEQLLQLRSKWRQWLDTKKLPELSPADMLSFLQLAEKARDVINRLRASREESRQVAGFVNCYVQKVNKVAATLQMEPVTGETVNSCVVSLFASLKEQEAKSRLRRDLQEQLKKAADAYELAGVELREVDAALKELLISGRARDEEEFRTRAAVFARREKLKHDLESQKEHILSIAGSPRNFAEFRAELNNSSREDNLQELEQVEQELAVNDKKIRQANNDIAANKLRTGQVEKGEELARARQEKDMLEQRLQQKAREWRVLTLCAALLDMAKETHERYRQPGVLLQAGAYLEPMTGGRYSRVISPVGAPGQLWVEEPRGKRVEAACLSRGAANQLFLSLRLALAKYYSESVAPLPLMLDDIMVDFDHRRLAGAIQVLREIAAEHQVLYFTCHRHVRDLFCQFLPEHKCINLDESNTI